MADLYRSATFMEHGLYPDCKYEMDDATHEHEGVNPSCGDELRLQLRVRDGAIEEAAFISQASADIMADLITGKTTDEAKRLAELFMSMVRGEALNEAAIADLGEAAQLKDIAHMPARVKCAQLAWRTLDTMI